MIQTPHIYWLHGFAGCGKSSISLEVAKLYAGSGRLLASYFFFRGAGDRSTMNRFAVTLASQLVTAIPDTAPLIQAALRAEPGLVTGDVSLATQLDLLILSPFQVVINQGVPGGSLAKGSFLIVVDGLDECEDERGVQEFIDHILHFFEKYPSIPLRIFIASRVEQHIRERLGTKGVLLGNLDSHSANEDIEKYLHASFQAAAERDRVIRAYVRARGEWPAKLDMNALIKHIGGSFVLASTIFKFIIQTATTEDSLTPMERLPLALKMNGLDGLYTQTLTRSQCLNHFRSIISIIALLHHPLPIVGIADLLGIEAFEVLRVLLNLQAIIHVPGSDEEGGVTLCHTSLRDFLTTERRSGSFFVPPSYHLHLSYYCFASICERNDGSAYHYGMQFLSLHRRSPALLEAYNSIDKIRQFKAPESLSVDRMPSWYAFVCTMFFQAIVWNESSISDCTSYILTECTKHLALAVGCADSCIGLWLGKELHYFPRGWMRSTEHKVLLTEQTYEAVQQHLQSASAAFPDKVRFLDLI
ncbi:hypothetical protein EST38_g7658 [Candolleomyces aberdarensis]|uniref:Nephrocystin 3-like N-terminal domain-containing protein n=1 Tax=Candolleomyces aberdarensis TaxID=2316362 RepID=A0A4Q2DEK1_9AGAR|nr:hypothetical protein EST38_g7658 [Candolleomyces aberdarensis]